MAIGLRQGALALAILETADLLYTDGISTEEGIEAVDEEYRQIAVAEEYRSIQGVLETCIERIRASSSQLEAVSKKEVKAEVDEPVADTSSHPDIIEIVGEMMSVGVASAGSCLL